MTTEEQIYALGEEWDFNIHNINYYVEAFTQRTYANEHKKNGDLPFNERLEFLGDKVLDMLVSEYLYINYPKMDEGLMTNTRKEFVCEGANCSYTRMLGLDKIVRLGKGEEKDGGRNKPSILGDLFEAFLGALYLDNGLEVVRHLLEKVVFPYIKPGQGYFKDYKTRLQEDLQSNNHNGIEYKVADSFGTPNDKTYVVYVFNDGIKLGEGIAKSIKEAEQQAAKNAYEKGIHQ